MLDSGDEMKSIQDVEAAIAQAVQPLKEAKVEEAPKEEKAPAQEMLRADPDELFYAEIDYSAVRGRLRDTSAVPCWEDVDYTMRQMMALSRKQSSAGVEKYMAKEMVSRQDYEKMRTELLSMSVVFGVIRKEADIPDDATAINLSDAFDAIAVKRVKASPDKYLPHIVDYVRKKSQENEKARATV